MHESPAATPDLPVLLAQEERCGSGFPAAGSGQASRDRMGRGRVICSTKSHSRGIDSGERGQVFGRGRRGKLGGHSSRPAKVVAPDALCFADDPASGAAPFCAAEGRASSGLPSPGSPRQARDKQGKLALRVRAPMVARLPACRASSSESGTTISTISLRRPVHHAS